MICKRKELLKLGFRYGPNEPSLERFIHLRARPDRLLNDGLKSLIAGLILLTPISTFGQSASDYGSTRLSCAQGLAEQAVYQLRAAGIQIGSAEMCVRALSWTANNNRLLDIYLRGKGGGDALALVNRLIDGAQSSTGPFRSGGSPREMWNKGELTPSLAFDAGFTRSYLNRPAAPSVLVNSTELNRTTEGCLRQTQPLAVCAELGGIQAALAYQMNNAFSNATPTPAPKSESKGADRAQTEAAIDKTFKNWAKSWSFDRYRPGSAQITNMSCGHPCKVSGRFSFVRMGSVHTIPFVAFMQSTDVGSYLVGRLCYNDETTGMLDCTQ